MKKSREAPSSSLWLCPSRSLRPACLFVYWFARTVALLMRSDEELDETLRQDLAEARRLWAQLRCLFDPYHGLIPY